MDVDVDISASMLENFFSYRRRKKIFCARENFSNSDTNLAGYDSSNKLFL